jgi:spore coat protein H
MTHRLLVNLILSRLGMSWFVMLLSCTGPSLEAGLTTATNETAAETSLETATTDTTSNTESTALVPIADGCEPGGLAYGLEGEGMSFSPSCQGVDEAVWFSIDEVPDGAMWDPDSEQLIWWPQYDQAGLHLLPVIAHSEEGMESGVAEIWIADGWREPTNTLVDATTYTHEYGLPVVHLERPPSANSSDYVDASFIYKGEEYAIGMKYRGASSLGYPKNSYTLKFPSDHEFRDDDIDFHKRHKIVLTTTFDDNSYLRQRLCFDIWNSLDAKHNQVQTTHAVVYINGEYEGLYLLGDHIDGEYWEDYGFREDGNTYKAVNHDANYYNRDPGDGFEKKEGEPASGAGAFTDLYELIAFVNDASDEEFAKTLSDRVAIDEFMDWWALVRYTEAGDSAGKNAYLYSDPEAPLFHYAPWDFNHSLGQDWMTLRVSYDAGDEFTGNNQLFARILSNSTLGPLQNSRWRGQLAGVLHEKSVNARIDEITDDIALSASRDWEKWEADYRSYGGWSWYRSNDWTSYEEEVLLVKAWVHDRHAWLSDLYEE